MRQFRSAELELGRPAYRTLAEQVTDSIVAMIASGALRPGQRLVESELAEQFRTSRVPIREALRILEAQGILATAPYRGTRVVEFGDREQVRIIEARIALERLIVRQAAQAVRREVTLLQPIDRVLGWMRDCALTGDRIGLNRADVEFHHQLCLLTGNAILTTLWSTIAHHVLIVFGLSNSLYPNSTAVLLQHRELRKALLTAPFASLGAIAERHVLGLDIPGGAGTAAHDSDPEGPGENRGGVKHEAKKSARTRGGGAVRHPRRAGVGTGNRGAGARAEPSHR